MAFPDAQSLGWVCDSSRAGVLRAGAELEQRDERQGGMGGVVLEGTWAHGAHRQHSYPERDNKHTVDGIYR